MMQLEPMETMPRDGTPFLYFLDDASGAEILTYAEFDEPRDGEIGAWYKVDDFSDASLEASDVTPGLLCWTRLHPDIEAKARLIVPSHPDDADGEP